MTASRSPAKRNAAKRQTLPPLPVKPKWVAKRKNPAKPKTPEKRGRGKKKAAPDHEYQIFWSAGPETWNIARDGGDTGTFAYDESTAIALAIRDAQHDHPAGLKVVVYVRRNDGSLRTEWTS